MGLYFKCSTCTFEYDIKHLFGNNPLRHLDKNHYCPHCGVKLELRHACASKTCNGDIEIQSNDIEKLNEKETKLLTCSKCKQDTDVVNDCIIVKENPDKKEKSTVNNEKRKRKDTKETDEIEEKEETEETDERVIKKRKRKNEVNEIFEIQFIAIGQGDCCMIRCPDNSIVMVDCGCSNECSLSHSDNFIWEAAITLRDWALKNKNKIDALIITHSDRDHYNKIIDMFGKIDFKKMQYIPSKEIFMPIPDDKLIKIGIDNIYFSNGNDSESNPIMSNYKEFDVDTYVKNNFKDTKKYEVFINSSNNNGNKLREWYFTSGKDTKEENGVKVYYKEKEFLKAYSDTVIMNSKHVVIEGTTEKKIKWSISIIAGNVKVNSNVESASDPNKINAKSLITLIEYGSKKVLLCGDATKSTEKFLLKTHANLIPNVDLVRIPHHGSNSASHKDFVEKTAPKHTVVSVGFYEHSFKLPRYGVIKRWEDKTSDTVNPSLLFDAWKIEKDEDVNSYFYKWQGAKELVKMENGSKYFFYRSEQEKNSVIAIYYNTYTLHRQETKKALRQTSQATQIYYLTADGVKHESSNQKKD